MKNKEILAESYADIHMAKFDLCKNTDLPYYHNDRNKMEACFIAGFNSGKKLKWNSVNDKLPKSDHHCLCWIKNEVNINYSNFEIGSYQNNNWYLKRGRQTHEIVTHWIKIEKPS